MGFTMADNGGRRSGIERRRFSYAEHIPERRSGRDRRSGKDRRCGDVEEIGRIERKIERKSDTDPRRIIDRHTSLFA
jgi:hypothetical protein